MKKRNLGQAIQPPDPMESSESPDSEVSGDAQRVLQGLPVTAQSDEASARKRKFAFRPGQHSTDSQKENRDGQTPAADLHGHDLYDTGLWSQ